MEEGSRNEVPTPQPESSSSVETSQTTDTDGPKTFAQLADHMEAQREETTPSQPLSAARVSRRGFLGRVLGLVGIGVASTVAPSVVGGLNATMDSTPQDGSDQQTASKSKSESNPQVLGIRGDRVNPRATIKPTTNALYTGPLRPSSTTNTSEQTNTSNTTDTQVEAPGGKGGFIGGSSSGLSKGTSAQVNKGS